MDQGKCVKEKRHTGVHGSGKHFADYWQNKG
jgi:hypothetical protein